MAPNRIKEGFLMRQNAGHPDLVLSYGSYRGNRLIRQPQPKGNESGIPLARTGSGKILILVWFTIQRNTQIPIGAFYY